MTWKVEYAETFFQDLKEIYSYIAYTLHEPNTAQKLVNQILDAADSLDSMPERYRVYDSEVDLNIRILTVKNYVILYELDKSLRLVKVLRAIYGGRDIPAQLSG